MVFAVFSLLERQVEARGGTPLVALRLLCERPFLVGIGLVLTAYASVNSFFLVLSLTLQDGMRLSALSAGLVYTPEAVTFFAVSLLAGRLAPRYGRWLPGAGAVILVVAYGSTAAVAAISGARLNAAEIIPTLILQGVGGALLLTPLFNMILSRMPPNRIGMASGLLSTAQQLGGALGVAVIGVLYFGSLSTSASATGTYAHALATAVIVNIVAAAIGSVLVLALPAPEVSPWPARANEAVNIRPADRRGMHAEGRRWSACRRAN